ncbi:unnamed protein product [Chironomus riparius]|uniref:Uncharacterized protein n=1 Tax=Chironomus riparius TaxID=315576 RepID=A0A9N9RXC6_9DIPT|nr:unnamed protein product [Chironomus riparius]
MKYQIFLFLSYSIIKLSDASNIRLNRRLISNISQVRKNEPEAGTTQNVEDYKDKKITCRCNICTDAYYCMTEGACFISSKHNQNDEKIYTQGCIDKVEDDESMISHFCRTEGFFPKKYERRCCYKNLCNGNATIPYTFDESYSTENIYLLTSFRRFYDHRQ